MTDSDSDVIIPQEPDENLAVRVFLRPRVLVLLAAAAAIYIAGPHLWDLLPDLGRRTEYRLKTVDIRFTEPPAWVPKTFLQQVIREGGLPDELSLLDDGIVDPVAAAFQKDPWVERVVSVHKDFARRLTVALKYRKPVGVVLIETERYPVDRDAVVLPPPELEPNAVELPPIRNAHAAPQGSVGRAWGDRAIEGAARLAEVLGPAWKKLKLESIEIPPGTLGKAPIDKIIYSLRAIDGSRIIWGRAPGTDHPGELTPEQKIGRLEEYDTRNGGYAGQDGPYEIDIRHWQDILRRPLSQRPGAEMQ